MNNLILVKKAESLADYFFIRQLRNKNCTFLTGSPSHIGIMQQVYFFVSTPMNISLYIAFYEGKRAGYLLLRSEGDLSLITEVVDSKYRGMGVATSLINFSKNRRNALRAHIQKDNLASLALHKKNNFIFTKFEKEYLVFDYKC